ncbi:hypothetical protein GCM10010498_58050 [Streptomyces cavourensis]|nr:hypothetical protein GCM10010498_58050 [Streptomyces cavourensis]
MAEGGRAVGGERRAARAALMGHEEPQLRGYFEGDLGSVHPARMPPGRGGLPGNWGGLAEVAGPSG